MMKRILLLAFLFVRFWLPAQNLYPTLFDQSGGITNGYGAWGTHQWVREAGIDVQDEGTITFYHPDGTPVARPTVFFISGWGQTYQSYDRFFKYVASLGYNLVNVYNQDPGNIHQSYPNALDMMRRAVQTYGAYIDTTRVALMGHSFGGGAVIWLGKQVFDPNGPNWGSNGRFIMVFAPWLSFLVTDDDLRNYPPGVKLLMIQSFDDIHEGTQMYNTDPRALRAVYQLINIPDNDKDFITLVSDTDPNHTYTYNGRDFSYTATHYVCYTDLVDGDNNPYDALDVYSSNRLFHAMASLVFGGDASARSTALGNGSSEQTDMGFLPGLMVTDYYVCIRPDSVFMYRCREDRHGTWGDPDIWKLQAYCDDADNDGHVDNLALSRTDVPGFAVFPNPAKDFIVLRAPGGPVRYQLISPGGKLLVQGRFHRTKVLPLTGLASGIYLIRLQHSGGEKTFRIHIR